MSAAAISLYPFQAQGLDDGRAAYRSGATAVLFVGPTGMGKTTLASAAAVGRVARGGRVVAIAHRRELVSQMGQRLARMGLDVGYLGLNPGARTQVVSVQTLLASRQLPDADFVILDEAHHYVSDEWIAIPRAYLDAGARVMGLTATPARDDGRALGRKEGGIFDHLVVVAQVHDLVKLNASNPTQGITPIEVFAPETKVRKLALDPHVAYLERAPGRSAAVFAPNVETAEVFLAGFIGAGVSAAIVHGKLPTEKRDAALAAFASGAVKVLVNVNVLTEGWDAPICDVCIIARKIGSLALLIQCIGRARRPHYLGKIALLIDLSSNLDTHGFHPDDELAYSLSGEPITVSGSAGIGPRICRKCRRVLDDDIAAARARGIYLERCPEPGCNTRLSRIVVPTAEEVELRRVERDEVRRHTPVDKRTKALTTMFANGLRAGHKKERAAIMFRRVFSQYPPADMKVRAWRDAVAIVAEERGDAWEQPPT